MAKTTSQTVLQSSVSNAAAATKTGTALDMRTKYGGFVTGIVTNGGTGPTLPCLFKIQTSTDNTTWRDAYVFTASTTASATTTFAQDIPWGVMYLRSIFTGNTAQAVTVMSEIGTVDTL